MCFHVAQAVVAVPEGPRSRPQRARSTANMSTESGLNSFGITDSGDEVVDGDEADMEEEVVGESFTLRPLSHTPG